MSDILTHILDCVADAVQLPEDVREMLDASIRSECGGDRHYITRQGEAYRNEMSDRNRAIIREWRAGERISYLARKYGITKQRVSKIVQG